MKYSDSVKAILLAAIDELAATPEKYAQRPGKDFTRHRKLGFRQLLIMFITMEGNASVRNSTLFLDALLMYLLKRPITDRCRSSKPVH